MKTLFTFLVRNKTGASKDVQLFSELSFKSINPAKIGSEIDIAFSPGTPEQNIMEELKTMWGNLATIEMATIECYDCMDHVKDMVELRLRSVDAMGTYVDLALYDTNAIAYPFKTISTKRAATDECTCLWFSLPAWAAVKIEIILSKYQPS
jgi:hypothetical protein